MVNYTDVYLAERAKAQARESIKREREGGEAIAGLLGFVSGGIFGTLWNTIRYSKRRLGVVPILILLCIIISVMMPGFYKDYEAHHQQQAIAAMLFPVLVAGLIIWFPLLFAIAGVMASKSKLRLIGCVVGAIVVCSAAGPLYLYLFTVGVMSEKGIMEATYTGMRVGVLCSLVWFLFSAGASINEAVEEESPTQNIKHILQSYNEIAMGSHSLDESDI